jgi:hypothetical protein
MKERMGAARPHRPTGIEEVGKMPTLLEDTGGTPMLPLKKRLLLRSTIHDPQSTIFLCDLCVLAVNLSLKEDAAPLTLLRRADGLDDEL